MALAEHGATERDKAGSDGQSGRRPMSGVRAVLVRQQFAPSRERTRPRRARRVVGVPRLASGARHGRRAPKRAGTAARRRGLSAASAQPDTAKRAGAPGDRDPKAKRAKSVSCTLFKATPKLPNIAVKVRPTSLTQSSHHQLARKTLGATKERLGKKMREGQDGFVTQRVGSRIEHRT